MFLGINLKSAPTESYKVISILESGILFSKVRGGAESVLVFCYCITNYQKFDSLKEPYLLFHIFHGLGAQEELSRVLCTGSQAAAIKVLPGAAFSSETQGLLLNSHMRSCRTHGGLLLQG